MSANLSIHWQCIEVNKGNLLSFNILQIDIKFFNI